MTPESVVGWVLLLLVAGWAVAVVRLVVFLERVERVGRRRQPRHARRGRLDGYPPPVGATRDDVAPPLGSATYPLLCAGVAVCLNHHTARCVQHVRCCDSCPDNPARDLSAAPATREDERS